MPVTSLRKLLDDKTFRESMNRSFSFPKRRVAAVLRTKPNSKANVNFGSVGTAYDYCLRLALIRTHNLDRDKFKSFPGFSYYVTWYQTDRNVRSKMEPHLRVLNDYLSFDLSDATSLFTACLFLAKFDSEYRSGLPIRNFAVKPQDVEELGRIVANSNLEWTREKDVVLGPVFDRSGSKLAINADADLIIGTTLVDVKTSSHIELKANIRQLLGYYTLNKFADTPLTIDRLGVYYPRFNFFLELPIRELLSESQEDALISLFRSALGDNIDSRSVRNLPQFVSSVVADAFITDEDGCTSLHYAVGDRNRATASALLQMGADVNAKSSDGTTPLVLAIYIKDMEMVKLLLDAGANVNVFDQDQSTPLLCAVWRNQKKLTELLLNAGADVNCQDEEGWTPLHYAVMSKQKNLIDLLIKHGANVDTSNRDGITPSSIASKRGNSQLSRLFREASKKQRGEKSRFPRGS